MLTVRKLALAVLTAGFAVQPTIADEPKPADQVRDQKEALAHAEQTARRITTSLRVLAYQKADSDGEQKLLDEVAASLKGLSQDQISAVLKHLEAAVKAPDEKTATDEQKQAYAKHRQVVSSLRGMLVKLDALKSLDQAATRLGRMADDERTMHEKSLRAGNFKATSRSIYRRAVDDREEQADVQGDLRTDLTTLVKQLGLLKPTLSPEQKDRLEKADVFGKSGRIMAEMELAAASLSQGQFNEASDRQLTVAKDLQSLAAALRTSRDKLTELREARTKLDNLVKEQEALKQETTDTVKAPPKSPQELNRFMREKQDPQKVAAHNLADKQDKLEFDTRDVRKKLDQIAPEVAAKLNPAEAEMKKAQEDLRAEELDRSTDSQERAEDKLTAAREALDKLIEKAEMQKSDPLAATKKAAEMVEKLIQEQKKTREDVAKENDKEKLKPAEKAQKEIAKKADEVKNLPLPENPELKEALNKAQDQAKKAADDLMNKDKPAAQPKQDETVKALEQAKKALEEKAKEIEKRREDLKKIEDAAEKLNELKKQEDKVAKDAEKNKDNAAENQKTAQDQSKITPPTKDVAHMVKDAAPDAAEKVKESAKAQEQAKKDLDKNKGDDAKQNAKDAAKKLDEAKEALAKKAEELKAKEIADQAALQPNQVDPAAAAKQLEKALENAQEAAKEAMKAGEDLAKAQKEVAEKADKAEQKDAAKDADAATKALEKGDIPEALKNQQKALDKLKDQAKANPMKGDSPMKGDAPMPGESPMKGDAGDVAKDQQKVKDATEALQKSQQKNQAAQAALNQAQAQAPQAVKPQLDKAAQQLADAGKQLGEAKPMQAGDNQKGAAQQLEKALGALQQAAKEMGQKPGDGGDETAQGEKPGDKPGQKPGDQPGNPNGKPGQQQAKADKPGQQPGQQPNPMKGDGEEKNEGVAEGNREGDAKLKQAASAGTDKAGDGTFIQLQKKERDKVQQNAENAFPAEFRELIKQYNINIKALLKPQTSTPAPAAKPEEKK